MLLNRAGENLNVALRCLVLPIKFLKLLLSLFEVSCYQREAGAVLIDFILVCSIKLGVRKCTACTDECKQSHRNDDRNTPPCSHDSPPQRRLKPAVQSRDDAGTLRFPYIFMPRTNVNPCATSQKLLATLSPWPCSRLRRTVRLLADLRRTHAMSSYCSEYRWFSVWSSSHLRRRVHNGVAVGQRRDADRKDSWRMQEAGEETLVTVRPGATSEQAPDFRFPAPGRCRPASRPRPGSPA